MDRLYIIITVIGILLWSGLCSFADTIVMNDNERLKGVIVEEYKDRVIISTMDGEKEVMKSNVQNVVYDLEEQNLASLGDFYQDRAMYRKAYFYYDKALKLNPEYKKAKEGLNYVGTYIQQTDRMRKLDHIKRLNQGKTWRGKPTTGVVKKDDAAIKEDLGIEFVNVGTDFQINEVRNDSPAEKAGVKKGDMIVAMWGRSISYMEPSDVKDKLSNTGVMDVQLTIERTYSLDLLNAPVSHGNLLGVQLGFSEMEGLIVEGVTAGSVAAKAGLKEGDIFTEIEGESTRYMPLKETTSLINSKKDGRISFKIKRDVVLWKKFNGA